MTRFLTMLLLALAMTSTAAGADTLPLVFENDFQKGADHWQPTDPKAWRIGQSDGQKVYEQFQNSKYDPPYRSPFNISLVKDLVVGDFVLTVKAKSTIRDYAHQDMCLFFGYQDNAHFYYVHLGKRADPNSCQIMIVNGAPRTKITKKESPGIPWDKNWHDVKIVRRVRDGEIEVYFDDLEKPVLAAADKTFRWGQVGIGSFDDTGMWREFRLRGEKVEKR